MEQKATGFLDTGCDLKNPNFALMADAMGVRGTRVEKPQELKGAVQAALAHKGPVLVDVVSARQELAMPPKTKKRALSDCARQRRAAASLSTSRIVMPSRPMYQHTSPRSINS